MAWDEPSAHLNEISFLEMMFGSPKHPVNFAFVKSICPLVISMSGLAC